VKTLVNMMLLVDPDCHPTANDLLEIVAGRF
jgi:hypothetical protein